jgi:hypothetical protein
MPKLAIKYINISGTINILAGECEIIKKSSISIKQKENELEKV